MYKTNQTAVCRDGFSMSVQASEYTYCEPRITGARKYTEAEVGFPSEKEDLLMPYMDGFGTDGDPTRTVYGWVPAEVIRKIIKKHGGLKGGELPPGI